MLYLCSSCNLRLYAKEIYEDVVYIYGVGFCVARLDLFGRCQSLCTWDEQKFDSHVFLCVGGNNFSH